MKEVVVLSAARTPTGGYLGAFRDIPGPRLGAVAINEALKKSGLSGNDVDECLMGCVLSGGVGQAPARQAALFAELPQSVRCTTINRVCGSSLKTVMFGTQMIQTEEVETVVAGGMESMSLAPYLVSKARTGYRMGHGKLTDLMIHDGLWDVYNNFHMGKAAELCAKDRNISRENQDRYATQSYQRALKATESGTFKDEIAPVTVQDRKGNSTEVTTDEDPFKAKLDRFAQLKPVFESEGTITAANSSTLSDGASALILSSQEKAQALGVKPIAKILAHASYAHEPEWFTTAPVGAIQKLLKKTNLSVKDIDLFEINEAFAVVALACIRELELNEEKVNVHGGAIALGHALGSSGSRILTTLLHALKAQNKRLGIAALCIGGGEGSAVLVENIA